MVRVVGGDTGAVGLAVELGIVVKRSPVDTVGGRDESYHDQPNTHSDVPSTSNSHPRLLCLTEK